MTTAPPGVANFRDAGGHATPHGPMVTGRLFRSAMLMGLDDPGGLDRFGIATVVDLRNDHERREHPTQLAPTVSIIDITIDPGAWRSPDHGLPTLEQVYREMIDWCGPQLAQAVGAVAEHCERPLLVHCTGGKDRTGVVVALVQAVLGVDDDVIAHHYAASERELQVWMAAPPPNVIDGSQWEEVAASGLLASPPEIMFDVLGRLRREHGSVEDFLAAHGAAESVVTRLQDHLVIR